MTRLTNDGRGKIVNMIIAHKFDPLNAAMLREENALALRLYNILYNQQQRTLMQQLVASTTKCVFAEQNEFSVNAGGWELKLKLAGPALFWAGHSRSWSTIMDISDEKLVGELKEFATRKKDLAAEEKHLRQQVAGQVDPYYTFDKLRASWPEIDRFVSAVEAGLPAPSSLPALADHKALNEVLDLPPETKAA